MENCLVTKLSAVVNNPNLPVLETMQAFTLNAITASGNSSMTDTQKWAFNHFFYQVGAIDNSGIWAKLKAVILPFVTVDADHAKVDYKTNLSEFAVSPYLKFHPETKTIGVLTSGGVQQVEQLKTIDTISLSDLSFISTFEQNTEASSNRNMAFIDGAEYSFTFYKRGNANFHTVEITNDPNKGVFYYRTLDNDKSNPINAFAISCNGTVNESSALDINGMTIKNAGNLNFFDDYTNKTITDGVLSIKALRVSSIIVGEFLTKTELLKLSQELILLKSFFID